MKREAKKLKNKSQREQILNGITNSKYVLLKNESELTDKEREKLEQLKEVAPELGKMHSLKSAIAYLVNELIPTATIWIE